MLESLIKYKNIFTTGRGPRGNRKNIITELRISRDFRLIQKITNNFMIFQGI